MASAAKPSIFAAKGKTFFFEKKNQKPFTSWGQGHREWR
jgi:hypothetical protein